MELRLVLIMVVMASLLSTTTAQRKTAGDCRNYPAPFLVQEDFIDELIAAGPMRLEISLGTNRDRKTKCQVLTIADDGEGGYEYTYTYLTQDDEEKEEMGVATVTPAASDTDLPTLTLEGLKFDLLSADFFGPAELQPIIAAEEGVIFIHCEEKLGFSSETFYVFLDQDVVVDADLGFFISIFLLLNGYDIQNLEDVVFYTDNTCPDNGGRTYRIS